ncbi:hypothetical protein N0U25_09525 [Pseudomonas sivasensis]|uniref:hypothetical protein n=1 Tax=Pseudomonas sivasensis TaxID=1880678 RepID=UPI0021AA4B2E|nr:hypothetical protein [Pseudomonas sivasensis]MCT4498031.1 hypothetical protein [Pseudomonas sivasensis]
MIELDLNTNDAEALLRHCESYVPTDDDPREKRRLQATLEALREALIQHLHSD